jgi:hypothetical protein
MYSRYTSGQPPPAPLSFSRLSRSTPRLLFAGVLVLGVVLCATAGLLGEIPADVWAIFEGMVDEV